MHYFHKINQRKSTWTYSQNNQTVWKRDFRSKGIKPGMNLLATHLWYMKILIPFEEIFIYYSFNSLNRSSGGND